ncbi:receptor-like protein kinase 2 [Selaginella moellendorffii]|uniref:receptor-like protein kinase 2 n=1 Tax=Selaginella moellendorffii TaxID=88036 RepID=UPI000D1D1071|nr:receptor-like protein kinase 2 [Selaginella moellendorffii]|eukprot:XP_024529702.1 receptor-like protein kinase 2 [Selaginella moellendorffii]
MTLLSGCKRHGDLDRGERAARKVFELAPAETLPHVFLSNMYAAAKRFDDARRVLKEMEERGVTSPVAVSYIEIDNELHMFTSGGRDEQHEGHDGRTMERVRSLLLELLEPMKQAGYVPDTREVYLEQQGGTSEEEKQRSLCFHSKRLAIAYGLIAAKDPDDSSPLGVVNSHRVCSDCHSLSDIIEKGIFSWRGQNESKKIVPDKARLDPLHAHKAGVLVALKRSLLGLGNTSDWTVENSDRACTDWKGVICNSDDSEVVELHLAGNGFTGEISSPALGQLASLRVLDVSKNRLVGSLPAELGLLQSLQALDVSGNRLTGSLPRDLGNCSALRFLNAQQNQLQGPIPPQLGALQRLEILVLDNNRLSGSLPPSLANCSKLQEIWLTSNDVEGEIPQEVGAMQELRVFFVERNRLEGLIPPVFANCSSLELLALGENSLGGRIPDELGRLENLVALSLYSLQQLEGPIPPEIGNNSKLEWFDINGNSLMHGSIPVSLLQLPRLATLQLSYFNNTSDRPVPEQLWNMTQLEFLGMGRTNSRGILSPIVGNLTRLRSLALNGNRFEGSVPDELSKCPRMETLILSDNRLLGGVPRSLGTLERLRLLMLDGNQLSGAIPEELGNCTNLEELVLERNFFRGAIPESIARMAKLRSLLLYGNQLSGVIPAPASPEMIDMRLHGNSLSGSIPPSVGNLSKLSILYLSNNKLDGSIPATLGQLRRLTQVDFSENQLTGGIPGSLASCDSLQLLDLSSNLLSGEIPASIGEWTGFQTADKNQALNISSMTPAGVFPENSTDAYRRTVSEDLAGIVDGHTYQQYARELEVPGVLDLSANQLTGEIPASLGKLAGVRELNLSHNRLSGGIPWTLGEMTSMAVLDLSFNRINGMIPGGLARLHLLKDLRVVFNDLEGRIPETLEFGASSYEGNPGLCGEPLSRPCEGDGLVDVGDGATWWKENVSNGAFVVGFLGGFFTMLWSAIFLFVCQPGITNYYLNFCSVKVQAQFTLMEPIDLEHFMQTEYEPLEPRPRLLRYYKGDLKIVLLEENEAELPLDARTLAQPTLAARHPVAAWNNIYAGTSKPHEFVLLVQSVAAVQCSRSVSEEVKIPKGVEIVNDIEQNGEHNTLALSRHRARGSRQLGVYVCYCSLASVHSSAYPPRTPELADKLASYSTEDSMVLYLEQVLGEELDGKSPLRALLQSS